MSQHLNRRLEALAKQIEAEKAKQYQRVPDYPITPNASTQILSAPKTKPSGNTLIPWRSVYDELMGIADKSLREIAEEKVERAAYEACVKAERERRAWIFDAPHKPQTVKITTLDGQAVYLEAE